MPPRGQLEAQASGLHGRLLERWGPVDQFFGALDDQCETDVGRSRQRFVPLDLRCRPNPKRRSSYEQCAANSTSRSSLSQEASEHLGIPGWINDRSGAVRSHWVLKPWIAGDPSHKANTDDVFFASYNETSVGISLGGG
jgi:hypothetical protein